ncbi:hypothetical protein AB5J62_19610 [Amycolatopsis sp. cg5]|uniref:hypothetical protein n=1 Tax=Amycolatopsis sp. cg5 TaxID=3238802 RepID=UPI003523A1B7
MDESVFPDFYREHVGRLTAFLLVQGHAPADAAAAAQYAMATARRQDGRLPSTAPELLTWAMRVAGDSFRHRPGHDTPAQSLLRLPEAVPAPFSMDFARLGYPANAVMAWASLDYPAGEIAYELFLPLEQVKRIITDGPLPERLEDLAGALDLDLDDGLLEVFRPTLMPAAYGFDAQSAIPPYCAPRLPGLRDDLAVSPSALRTYAMTAASRPAAQRVRHRYGIPAGDLGTARLAAWFAAHTDRFRRDQSTMYWGSAYADTDLNAFAAALTRDIARLPHCLSTDVLVKAGQLANAAHDDEPDWNDVKDAALALASALSTQRETALDRALDELRPQRYEPIPLLKDALTRDLIQAHTMSLELGHLAADAELDLALPECPGTDLTRDLATHEAFNLALVNGIDAIESALTDLTAADLSTADLRGIELAGVRWSEMTRWPADRADDIRAHSRATAPGHYTVSPGLDRWPG